MEHGQPVFDEIVAALDSPDGRLQAEAPMLLFGSSRKTAILATWQAGADAYLTNPSSPDVPKIVRQLCETARSREAAREGTPTP